MVKMEFLQCECLSQLNWRISGVLNVCILCFRNITEFCSEERLRAAVETEHSIVTSALTKFPLSQQYSYVELLYFCQLVTLFCSASLSGWFIFCPVVP